MPKLTMRPARNPLRLLSHAAHSHWRLILALASLMLVEVCVHVHNYSVPRPSTPLDAPFYTGRQTPIRNSTTRESAVFMMLARNSEVQGAVSSVRSVQEQFNDNFGYPWVFLNDEEWSEEFKQKVGGVVGGSAEVKFEVIPKAMWGYPEWIDQERAKQSMQDMRHRGIQYGGQESYHHMCRFQSGYATSHISSLSLSFRLSNLANKH
jgi:mannosyltransferase